MLEVLEQGSFADRVTNSHKAIIMGELKLVGLDGNCNNVHVPYLSPINYKMDRSITFESVINNTLVRT